MTWLEYVGLAGIGWLVLSLLVGLAKSSSPPRCPWCNEAEHQRNIDRFRCQVTYQAKKRDGTPIYCPGGKKRP